MNPDVAAALPEMTGMKSLAFEDGLLGFPHCRSFRLLATEFDGLYWLESTDCEPLAFLLADPFFFFEGYSIDLSGKDLAALRPARSADVAVLATVTLGAESTATANLQGPIAINLATGHARQIVTPNARFGVREPITLDFVTRAA